MLLVVTVVVAILAGLKGTRRKRRVASKEFDDLDFIDKPE